MANEKDCYRTQEIAKIHVAKRDLDLNDEAYRAVLLEVAGVDSAATLDWKQRAVVLKRMEEPGWRPKPAPKAVRNGRPCRKLADDPKSRMIRAL